MKQSDIQVRLVPPSPNLHFLGRVEVLYNDQWGTVCDDLFYRTEANVICFMLNFTRGAVCSVSNAQFGQGRGSHFILLYYKTNIIILYSLFQVQFGWIMLTVGLEMRFWKIAITTPGEIPVVPIVKMSV